jgi:CRP/FNR family transcriptional regulator
MSAIAYQSRPTDGRRTNDRASGVRAASRPGADAIGPCAGSSAATVVLETGQCLYHAGERPDAGYIVKSGLLRQAMFLADGRRQIVRFVFPDDVLDWTDAAVMPFSVEAVEHTKVRCISRAQLERMFGRNARAHANWKRLGERRFHEMQSHAVVLGRLSSIERLAYFLIWLSQRTAAAPDGLLHLPMMRGDIADYLGLTVETVSRGFTILRDMGLIDPMSSRHVRLKKPAALRSLAGDIPGIAAADRPHAPAAIDNYSLAS